MTRLQSIQESIRGGMARLFGGAGRAIKANPAAQIMRIVAEQNHANFPRLDVYDGQASEYLRSAWVYVAVTRIAETAALVPFNVYAMQGEAKIAQQNHPIEALLRAPNPFMSQFELLEATFGYLELTGNAFWFLAGEPGFAPQEVWMLRPDRMRIVPDERRFVGGYVYTVNGVEIPLRADEVIHFKRWHPRNDYYGLSALEAAAVASQTDRAMSRWNLSFFSRETTIPAGIVNIRNMVSDADFERIIREFKETYGTGERRTAFIRGGDVTWSDLGLSHRDSDFLASREFAKEEVLQIFGIPAGLYAKNATEANATVSRETFINDTIWPKLIRFSQKLTQQLAPFYGANLLIAPEDIRDSTADRMEAQIAGQYLTVNEVRERYFHLPPIEGGDEIKPHPPAPSPLRREGESEERQEAVRVERLRQEGRDRRVAREGHKKALTPSPSPGGRGVPRQPHPPTPSPFTERGSQTIFPMQVEGFAIGKEGGGKDASSG